MNTEEIPIVPIIVGALALLYFGYEVERQRNKLRQIFNVFDREESEIASCWRPWSRADSSSRTCPESKRKDGTDLHQPPLSNSIAMTVAKSKNRVHPRESEYPGPTG